MGCTHYPILKDQIQNILGDSVKIINVGTYSANETYEFLKENNIENDSVHKGCIEFFASDDFETFKENAKMLGFEF